LNFLRRTFLFSGIYFAIAFPAAAIAQLPVDHMVVFGDSLSDNGNLYTVVNVPAPPSNTRGRSTDGPDSYPATALTGMWEEQLATLLGLPNATPYLVNTAGQNFAFAGAETGTLANSATGPYGMAAQVQKYLSQNPANIATALHTFWGGTNDVFDYPDAVSSAQGSVQNIAAQIGSVAAAGGKYFIWLNLPPLDLSPRGAGRADLHAATALFALSMQDAITSLHTAYPNIVIVPVDVYSLYKQVIEVPAEYGLTNATSQSQGYAVNPDQYLYWDYLHPTTRMHQIIANLAQSELMRALNVPTATAKTVVSDDFVSVGVDPATWAVEAPPDATVTVANSQAILSLPAGANHDAFVGGNHSVRLLQPVSNTDLDVVAKFDASLVGNYVGQGIMVQQDEQTYLRLEVDSSGGQASLVGASVSGGGQTTFFSTPLAAQAGSVWLEVKRTGDMWTLNSSVDGVNFTTAGNFSQPLQVTAIGPYAWNFNANPAWAPAVTSQVDYFQNHASQ
jgi:phospholipase/lecithinase/hemolysin/regulation of enolase protein 1 (concanavalin A-like superfamily)